jgi:hypothetical protein
MKKKKPILKELNDEERYKLLPLVIRYFQERTDDNKHITCEKLVDLFSRNKEKIGVKCAINSQRIMKMTNYIRSQQLLPLMSGPTGYYITQDEDIIEEVISSLKQRIESQMSAIKGLENFLRDIRLEREINKVEKDALGFTWN